MSESEGLHPTLKRIQFPALLAGLVGLALCAVGFFSDKQHFFMSYLFAFVFWIGIPLGCLAILMLQHLTGGAWGLMIRRALEAGTRLLPLMAILFIPLLFGIDTIYVWARPDVDLHGNEFKAAYLTKNGFIYRAVGYFAIWIIWSLLLNKFSGDQDRTGDPRLVRRMQVLSGPGILLYGVTVTFAAIDWVMSLDPLWFSTIWGLMFIAGQGLSTFAFVIAVVAILSNRAPFNGLMTRTHFQDLGNLLLAFTMLWAYMNFSQYLIIWSGNMAEETPYYFNRTRGGWQYVGLFLVIFHFFIPFILLLSRKTKRTVRILATVSVAIVAMRAIDLYWVVVPQYDQAVNRLHPEKWGWNPHWLDLAAPIGIGGIAIAFFIWQLNRRPVLPPNDPRLATLGGLHD